MITLTLRCLRSCFFAGAITFFATAPAASASALPYAVEFTPKGFLKEVTLADGTLVIERLGDFVLQARTTDETGKTVHSHVAGPYGADYLAETEETKSARGVTYTVAARHPRFQYSATYVCLPASIKVSVVLKPVDMKIDGGHVQMIFPVKFAADFVSSEPEFRTDNVRFTTARGVLVLVFDNINWARFGANGLRGFNGDGKTVNFYLSPRDLERPEEINLKFEILLPGLAPVR